MRRTNLRIERYLQLVYRYPVVSLLLMMLLIIIVATLLGDRFN